MSNDQLIEVKDGVSPGETVLLNPRAFVEDARTSPHDADKGGVNVNERFGASRQEDASKPGNALGGPRNVETQDGPPRGPEGRQGAAGTPPGPPDGGPAPAGRRGGGPPGNLMQLDADGDGKISRDEAPEAVRQFFDRMDTDGDGFVSRAEANALRQRRRAAEGEAGGPPGGPPSTP